MIFQALSPSPALQNIVDRYWISEYVIAEGLTLKLEGIPNGSQNIIFSYGNGNLHTTTKENTSTYQSAIIAGQLTSKSANYFRGEIKTFAIQFTPTGFFELFGIPMQEFTDKGIVLEDVLGKEGKELNDQVIGASKTNERKKIIEQYLFKRLIRNTSKVHLMDKAVGLIRLYNGNIPLATLADQLNTTKRTLERHFEEKTGLMPKLYMRVVRFFAVRTALQVNPSLNAYDIIHQYGYYDQSHLIKDFHFFADQTLSSYRACNHDFDAFFTSP